MTGTTLNKMKLVLFRFKSLENRAFKKLFYLYDINTDVFLANYIYMWAFGEPRCELLMNDLNANILLQCYLTNTVNLVMKWVFVVVNTSLNMELFKANFLFNRLRNIRIV